MRTEREIIFTDYVQPLLKSISLYAKFHNYLIIILISGLWLIGALSYFSFHRTHWFFLITFSVANVFLLRYVKDIWDWYFKNSWIQNVTVDNMLLIELTEDHRTPNKGLSDLILSDRGNFCFFIDVSGGYTNTRGNIEALHRDIAHRFIPRNFISSFWYENNSKIFVDNLLTVLQFDRKTIMSNYGEPFETKHSVALFRSKLDAVMWKLSN